MPDRWKVALSLTRLITELFVTDGVAEVRTVWVAHLRGKRKQPRLETRRGARRIAHHKLLSILLAEKGDNCMQLILRGAAGAVNGW